MRAVDVLLDVNDEPERDRLGDRDSPNGSLRVDWRLPNTPAMSGAVFHSQCAFLQPGANPLGVFFTNGQTNTVGAPVGVSRMAAGLGGSGGSPELQTGLLIGLN